MHPGAQLLRVADIVYSCKYLDIEVVQDVGGFLLVAQPMY
jgi:hypothetical protein